MQRRHGQNSNRWHGTVDGRTCDGCRCFGYLHEVQAKYAADAESLEKALTAGTGGNQTQMKKELSALKAKQEEMHVFEEKIHHYADIRISIDLDDGVKHNYALFADVLAKLK